MTFCESSPDIETHAAYIFFDGEKVLKVKKAVRLPFLDFSTREARHAALSRELELNKVHAPDLYQAVVPLFRDGKGRFVTSGGGEPDDWGLVMKRFDQDNLLVNIAAQKPLKRELCGELADMVARMHTAATICGNREEVVVLKDTFGKLFQTLDASEIPRADISFVRDRVYDALERFQSLIDMRSRLGAVRRCHGDLHLRNIVLIEGQPVPFDALEFSEDLATVDVLDDLAFLLMDLYVKDQAEAAAWVLNAYFEHAPLGHEASGLSMLPLFLCKRSLVRAVVAIERSKTSSDNSAVNFQHARDLVLSAKRFIAPPEAQLIAVGGFSGTGKSTLAGALSPHLAPLPGALVIRSDIERKRLFGVAPTDRLNEEHYSEAATAEVYGIILAQAERVLRAGHSAILDAVFARSHEREAVRELSDRLGVAFQGLWLQAPADEIISRVEARIGDASDATADVVEQQLSFNTGRIDWARINTANAPQDVADKAIRILAASPIKSG